MAQRKFSHYAVKRGHRLGIYKTWDECSAQVNGYPQAQYKGFHSLKEAQAFLSSDEANKFAATRTPSRRRSAELAPAETASALANQVVMYTDGGCDHNPGGRGGYGVVVIAGDQRKELTGGFRRTTNNRMELTAAIVGLSALKRPCAVTLYTDSRYVHDGITKGWAKRWRANDWTKQDKQAAANTDLWEQLLDLCDKHTVTFEWVRGHAGHDENERCDELATQAQARKDLPADEGYEAIVN